MSDFNLKLQKLKFPLVICGITILSIVSLTMENRISIPKIVPIKKQPKSMEEIMHGSTNQIVESEWDKDFKSAIIEEVK